MSKKDVHTRLEECIRLRSQWAEVVPQPPPPKIIRAMNAFVKDGQGSSGTTHFCDRKVEYQFATAQGRESFINIKACS